MVLSVQFVICQVLDAPYFKVNYCMLPYDQILYTPFMVLLYDLFIMIYSVLLFLTRCYVIVL